MKGERNKTKPGPITHIKGKERNSGEKKARGIGFIIVIFIFFLLALALLRCGDSSADGSDRSNKGSKEQLKTCSSCNQIDPHHAGNCPNKQ